MCTFYSTLPKQSKSTGLKKKNLVLSMKPCKDEKTFYRFRLLAFSSDGKNDRDFPWIQRFMHVKWGVHPEKGYPMIVDSITCPVTPHVHVEGSRYSACKMCDVANKYFVRFKESGWKDREASKMNKEFGRKLEYDIPVYVVNDPNYEGNNGKFKVIQFNDKKFYEEFKAKVEKQSRLVKVFNGENAVDCCFHVSEIEEIKNEGQSNQYTWKHKVIDKVIFSTKPYDIPSINKDTVSSMGFDEEFYTSSTPEEIEAFYKKWCTVSNDDIPDDDADIPVYDAPVKSQKVAPVKVENPTSIATFADDVSTEELEDLTADIGETSKNEKLVEEASAKTEETTDEASSSEIEDLLKDIDL